MLLSNSLTNIDNSEKLACWVSVRSKESTTSFVNFISVQARPDPSNQEERHCQDLADSKNDSITVETTATTGE